MCGIAGFCLNDNDLDIIDGPKLARELLLNIEHRGKDATGAAWYEGDTLMVQKDAMKASHFVKWMDLPLGARTVILHTRFATQGSERDNNNNHPVIHGPIVGVHNGVLYNDDSLFRRMDLVDQRVGEVDTEAIFAAIAYGAQPLEDGKFRLGKDLQAILEEISGSAAIAWLEIEGDPRVLHVARINQSPLVVAQTPGGSLIFGSEQHSIEDALKRCGGVKAETVGHMKEGTYFKIENGSVVDSMSFVPTSAYRSWSDYESVSGSYYSKQGKVTSSTPKSDSVVKAVHALSPPVKDDDKDESKSTVPEWKPYLSHESWHRHMIDQFSGNYFACWEDDEYLKHYRYRHEAIEEYIDTFGVEEALRCGAEFRPGFWVKTDIGNLEDDLDGQIVTMPQSFPTGSYVVRLLVGNSRYHDGYEVILVERTVHELSWLGMDDEDDESWDERDGDDETVAVEMLTNASDDDEEPFGMPMNIIDGDSGPVVTLVSQPLD